MIHEDLCEVNLIINPKNRMIEIIDFVTAAKINLSNFRSVFNDLSDMITYCKSRFRFLELFRKLDNMHTALDEIESNWPELSPEMSHHNLTLNQIKALVDDTIRELNQLLIELNRFPKVETIYDLEEDDNINRKRLRPFELSDPEQALMADDYESQVFIPSLDQFSLRKRQKRDEVKLDKLMTDYIQELDNEGKNQAKPATIS